MDRDTKLTLPRRWRAQRLTARNPGAAVVELVEACGTPQCPLEDVCARYVPHGECSFGPADVGALEPCEGFIAGI